jgi:para-nitrobenzyl esterase
VAARRGGRTWFYLFSALPAPGPVAARHGAFHGADVRVLFDAEMGVPLGEAASRAGDAMRRYWVRFAEAGDPNPPGLPEWPVYRTTRPRHLDIGDPVRTVDDLDRPVCRIFDEAWEPRGAQR